MKRKLPLPTAKNPYAQIDYLFNLVADTKHSKSTRQNYLAALKFYKKFLATTFNYNTDLEKTKLVYLDKHFNELTLVNLNRYLDEFNKRDTEGYLSSTTINGYFSSVRQVFYEAMEMGLLNINSIIDQSISGVAAETDVNTSYSEKEMSQIKKALEKELIFVYKVYRRDGYKKRGVGQDPRGASGSWASEEDVRWYFENILNCVPIYRTPENVSKHNSYFNYAPRVYFRDIGGLKGLYREWGIVQLVDTDVIMPLVIKMALLTGLNVDSIIKLKTDCFEEKNAISGVPVLKYFKRRSKGSKEMHLNSNDENVEHKEFRQDQIKEIKKLITITLSITSFIREKAPNNLKENLFIFQSSSVRKFGEVVAVSFNNSSNWNKKFVEKHQLKNDLNEPLNFNLKRFRPTRATDLVRKGIDLVALQHEMGHESILTTLGYVEKQKLNKEANEETKNAIENIFKNKTWAESNPITYINNKNEIGENTLFKGILCDCKNPFMPPKEVQALKSYNEGDACSRVNMCLFCDNVMIFKRNLPGLWMYKRQIDRTLDMQNVDLPYQNLYLKTLDIINQLFDEKNSEFSIKDLEEAKEIAANLDEYIDPITYQSSIEGE